MKFQELMESYFRSVCDHKDKIKDVSNIVEGYFQIRRAVENPDPDAVSIHEEFLDLHTSLPVAVRDDAAVSICLSEITHHLGVLPTGNLSKACVDGISAENFIQYMTKLCKN